MLGSVLYFHHLRPVHVEDRQETLQRAVLGPGLILPAPALVLSPRPLCPRA